MCIRDRTCSVRDEFCASAADGVVQCARCGELYGYEGTCVLYKVVYVFYVDEISVSKWYIGVYNCNYAAGAFYGGLGAVY